MKRTKTPAVVLPPAYLHARAIGRIISLVGAYYLVLSLLFGMGSLAPRMMAALPVSVAVGLWAAWHLLFRKPGTVGLLVHAGVSFVIAVIALVGMPFAAVPLYLVTFFGVLVLPAAAAQLLYQKRTVTVIVLCVVIPLIKLALAVVADALVR